MSAFDLSAFDIGLASFVVLLVLIALRAPIGLAMLLCALIGTALVMGGWAVPLNRLKSEVYTLFSNYSYSIVPLFILMGQFAALSGLSSKLFRAGEAWLGHKKGGVAMAAIGACAGFGAICGSSLATAATMGKVTLPELKRYGYEGGFASATLAAGGTLGILIPPSVILVIYALLTEQNIEKLFLAAIIPGLLAALGYIITIAIYVRIFQDSAGARTKASLRERWRALQQVWPVLLVFVIVIGGIYGGFFSPTDGASVGVSLMFLLALRSGEMSWPRFCEALYETAKTTAMIFFIILGASFYNGFLALTLVPQELASWITSQGFQPYLVVWLIVLFYLIFGCVMDSLSMILLTVPIFFPIITALDLGMSTEQSAIWFGILALIAVEVGLITPPVGMNLFVISAIDPSTPILKTYRAVLFFIASDLVRIVLLLSFPALVLLWL